MTTLKLKKRVKELLKKQLVSVIHVLDQHKTQKCMKNYFKKSRNAAICS